MNNNQYQLIGESVWDTYQSMAYILAEMGPEAREYRKLRSQDKTGKAATVYGTIPVKATRQAFRRRAERVYTHGQGRKEERKKAMQQDLQVARGIVDRTPAGSEARKIATKRAIAQSEKEETRRRRRAQSRFRQAHDAGKGLGAQIEDDG